MSESENITSDDVSVTSDGEGLRVELYGDGGPVFSGGLLHHVIAEALEYVRASVASERDAARSEVERLKEQVDDVRHNFRSYVTAAESVDRQFAKGVDALLAEACKQADVEPGTTPAESLRRITDRLSTALADVRRLVEEGDGLRERLAGMTHDNTRLLAGREAVDAALVEAGVCEVSVAAGVRWLVAYANRQQEEVMVIAERAGVPEEERSSAVEAAEAMASMLKAMDEEVTRLRALINRDQTGLARAMNSIKRWVDGHFWIPLGEWGSYEFDERTEEALRSEVGELIDGVTKIIDQALADSGTLAGAAYHPSRGVPPMLKSETDSLLGEFKSAVDELVTFAGDETHPAYAAYAEQGLGEAGRILGAIEAMRDERNANARLQDDRDEWRERVGELITALQNLGKLRTQADARADRLLGVVERLTIALTRQLSGPPRQTEPGTESWAPPGHQGATLADVKVIGDGELATTTEGGQ